MLGHDRKEIGRLRGVAGKVGWPERSRDAVCDEEGVGLPVGTIRGARFHATCGNIRYLLKDKKNMRVRRSISKVRSGDEEERS